MTHNLAPDPVTIDQMDGEEVNPDILSALGLSTTLTVSSEVVHQFNRLSALALALEEGVPKPKFIGAVALSDQEASHLDNDQAVRLALEIEQAGAAIRQGGSVPVLALSRYEVRAAQTAKPSGIFFKETEAGHGYVQTVIPSTRVFKADINDEKLATYVWRPEVETSLLEGISELPEFYVPKYVVTSNSSEESLAAASHGFSDHGTEGGVLVVGEEAIYAFQGIVLGKEGGTERETFNRHVLLQVIDQLAEHEFSFPGVQL